MKPLTARKEEQIPAVAVWIIDDQLIFREGLRHVLEAQGGLKVGGTSDTIALAAQPLQRRRPDVVLLVLRPSNRADLNALPRLLDECPWVRVIVLSDTDARNPLPALRLGARGVLPIGSAPSILSEAIQAVARGEIWADPETTGRLVDEILEDRERGRPEDLLSPRERQILGMIARGMHNPEIAHTLFITENTVKKHISHMMEKLGVHDRVQLALLGAQLFANQP